MNSSLTKCSTKYECAKLKIAKDGREGASSPRLRRSPVLVQARTKRPCVLRFQAVRDFLTRGLLARGNVVATCHGLFDTEGCGIVSFDKVQASEICECTYRTARLDCRYFQPQSYPWGTSLPSLCIGRPGYWYCRSRRRSRLSDRQCFQSCSQTSSS